MVQSISPGLTSIPPAYKGWMECQGAQTGNKVNREEILMEKRDRDDRNRTEALKIIFFSRLHAKKMINQGIFKSLNTRMQF